MRPGGWASGKAACPPPSRTGCRGCHTELTIFGSSGGGGGVPRPIAAGRSESKLCAAPAGCEWGGCDCGCCLTGLTNLSRVGCLKGARRRLSDGARGAVCSNACGRGEDEGDGGPSSPPRFPTPAWSPSAVRSTTSAAFLGGVEAVPLGGVWRMAGADGACWDATWGGAEGAGIAPCPHSRRVTSAMSDCSCTSCRCDPTAACCLALRLAGSNKLPYMN